MTPQLPVADPQTIAQLQREWLKLHSEGSAKAPEAQFRRALLQSTVTPASCRPEGTCCVLAASYGRLHIPRTGLTTTVEGTWLSRC